MDEKEIQKARKKNDRKVLMKGFFRDLRKTKFRFKDFISEFIFLFIVLMLAGKIIGLFTFKSKVIAFIFEILIITLVAGLATVAYNLICNLFKRKSDGYLMKKLNSGQKVGLLIQLITGIIMIILVLVEKPIFDFVVWIFFIGIIITLLSSLLLLKK